MKNLENLGASGHFVSELWSWQSDHGGKDGVDDERVVVHQLVRSERGHCVQELLGSCLEVSHQDGAQALVDLETVSSIPVTALFDKSDKRRSDQCYSKSRTSQQLILRFSLVQVTVDQVVVEIEEAQSNLVEGEIKTMTKSGRLLIRLSELSQSCFLIANQ